MYCTRNFTVNCALTQSLVWVIQILMILFSPSTWCIIIAFLDELQAEHKYLVLMNSGLLCVSVSAVQQICIHPWRISYAQGRTSPFLPHLPLPVYLAGRKQNNLFFSIYYWSPQPWHLHHVYWTHSCIPVCHVFCYKQTVQILKSVHRLLAKG